MEANVEAGPRVEGVGAVQICGQGESKGGHRWASAFPTCHDCDVVLRKSVARAREQGDRGTLL
jgi:hypothetical protein